MAIITKNGSFNVAPTEVLGRQTSSGSDYIYVVQGGLGGTIDGGLGSDHLILDQTAATSFVLAPLSSFASLIGVEIVSLGTKVAATPTVPSTAGTVAHNINASGYTLNGLTINGNAGANIIVGTNQADIITGGNGTDSLNGGDGSDTYIYATSLDFDAEKSAGLNDTGASGTDTVSISAASGTFTLANFANGIEAYTITSTGTVGINAAGLLITGTGLTLTGGIGANAITGTNFADIISGGAGVDDLKGGGGDDLFLYAVATDFTGAEKIDGGAGTSDTIRISAPSGIVTLTAVVTNIELVELTGTGDNGVSAALVTTGLTITGNSGANTITGTNAVDNITGGAGNDTIASGNGADIVDGGEGSDTYIVSSLTDFPLDVTTDTGTVGTDTARITATTGTLALTGAAYGIEAYTIVTGTVGINAALAATGLSLTGSSVVNTLTGTAFADVITGGAGADILAGGAGNDIFDYALSTDIAATESINGGADTDTIRFSGTTGTLTLGNTLTSVEQVLLAGSSNIGVNASAVATNGLVITGNDGNNTIVGTNLVDTIDGGIGNDTLTGGGGDDTLLGGLGNDTFIVALGSDHGAGETINGQEGTDTISFAGSAASPTLTLTAGDDVENIVMAAPTGTLLLNVDASAMTTTGHGVSITGNAGANVLTGSDFDDTLSGAAGNDTLNGGDGNDTFLYATQAEYTGDTLNGGAGTDTLRFNATAATPAPFTLAATLTTAGIEAIALGTSATSSNVLNVDASLVNSALTIHGNAAANAIRGSQAIDTLNGGGGNDIFLIKDGAHHGAGEVISGGAGTDEIRFDATVADSWLTLSTGVGADVERAVIGTGTGAAAVTTATTALNIDASDVSGAITLVGSNGANILIGGAGNDVLDGGIGNDLMDGGAGSDTYDYTVNTNYGIEELISDSGIGGTDTVRISAGSIALRDDVSGIEQVTLNGTAGVDASAVLNALSFTGGTGNNAITGTAFADVFTGGTGVDTMNGNGGADVFLVATSADGIDVINGGTGYDTVRFLGTGATASTNTLGVAATTNVEEIEISDADGLNTGTASLNINAAAVTASGIRFTGNAGVNTITGGTGADIIDGGVGNDILNGGAGNDVFLVGNGADHVAGEKIDGGAGATGGTADVVRFTSTTGNDTLILLANTANIEGVAISNAAGDTTGTTALNVNASAVTTALTITGNDGANTITGTNAADTINAGGGDDIIIVSTAASHGAAEAINGGGGSDTIRYTSTTAGETLTTSALSNMENIVVGTAGGLTTGTTALNVDASNSNSALTITGNWGVNTLSGSRFDDTLAGNAGNDLLNGASGNDTLDGGAGNDILNGDAGDDSFRDINIGDQVFGGAGNDALAASTATPDFNLTDLAIGTATTVNLVERIDLTGVGANVLLTFVAADIEAIVGAGGTLVIDADVGDELFSTEDWGLGVVEGLTGYTRYSTLGGNAEILVTSAVGFGKTFIGTTGADIFTGSNSPDTFKFTAATLGTGDELDGGASPSGLFDKIIITGGNIVNFITAGATISNIEVIQIGDDLNTQLVLQNGAITVNTVAGFGNGNNTITLSDGTGGAQDVTTGDGDDTINILGTSTESAFTLDGGVGNDTLAISGGGDLDLTLLADLDAIENISIDDTATIFTANNATLAITAGDGGNTITLGSGTQSVNSGDGADTINLGSGINVVNTGDGADTVNGALDTGDAVDLDAGNDTYTLDDTSTDGTVSGGTGGSDTLTIGVAGNTSATITLGDGANTTILGVDYSNFDNLAAGASDDGLTVFAAAGGSTINTGSGVDDIYAGIGIDIIDTGAGGDDYIYVTSGTYSGDTLTGGAGGDDRLKFSGGGALDMTAVGTTISGLEFVDIDDNLVTTFTANGDDLAITAGNGANTFTLGAGTQSITAGSGNDTVNLGSGVNNINTAGGSDTVNGILDSGDVVDLGAGSDSFAYQDGLLGDVRGGADNDTITVGAGSVSYGFNLDVGPGAGFYSGFENLSGAGATAGLGVTAAAGGSTITTGSGSDEIDSGIGIDTINAGANDDWVYITAGTYVGDSLDGGADTDTLYIYNGGTVNISTGVTVSNFENVFIDNNSANVFTANSDNLAITVANGNVAATINLGIAGTQSLTITGSGNDIVNLGGGDNNVNTGDGADTVNGTVQAGDLVDLDAGNDSFAWQTLAGDVRGGAGTDTLTYGGSSAVNLDLNVGTGAGNYSGFESINASGASGAFTVVAAAGGGSLTTGSGNDDITAGAGTDVIDTRGGDDTVRITSATYSGDTLNGGLDTTDDTLAITGGGAVDISTGASVSGFEKVTIDNSAVAANVFTANNDALAITVSGGDVGATINLGDTGTQSLTITGTGNDTVELGSGINNVNTGDGSDTVNGTLDGSDIVDLGAGADSFAYQTLSGDVRGGAGTDTITYGGAGPISINLAATAGATKYSGFENVSVTGTGDVTIIAATGGSTIATADGADILTTGIGIDNFDTGAGNDTVNITSSTYAGDTLNGGDDTDTLAITGSGTVNMNLASISNFENVSINNTSAIAFTANGDNLQINVGGGSAGVTINLGVTGFQNVTILGTGNDTVALGGGDNIVDTGDGADSVTGTVGANDDINLGDGSDSYAYQSLTAGGTVSGGAGNDTLIYSGSADQVIDFLTTTDNIAAEFPGAYSNFESLNATASVGFLNVTAAAMGGTINTGTGNDTITLGAGVDLVNTGAGADTVFGAVGAGDQINLAGADDAFAYQSLVATALVDGGTSADTLTYAGSDALVINFTNTTDNIINELGIYQRFENLLAGSATGQLDVTASTGGSTIITGSGNDTVTMGAGTDSVSTGAGSDEVIGTLGAGEAINLGADDDDYGYQVTIDAANVINADAGTGDNLTYSGAASLTIDFSDVSNNIDAEAGFYRNFENLQAGSAIGSYIVTAATTGSIINTGSGIDTITLGAGTDTVNAGGNSDTVNNIGTGDNVNLGDDADTAIYSEVAATVSGGTGGGITDSDTLQINSTAGAMTINLSLEPGIHQVTTDLVGTWTDFEHLSAAGASNNLTVTANAGGSVITTGSGDDNVTLGAGIDTANVGDGSDTVNNIGDGDTVNLGDGDDTATYSAAINATIDGGGHINGDTLIIASTTTDMTLNLSLVDLDQVTVGGAVNADWKNFENLSASGATHALTVTASSLAATIITTGSGNDAVTLGAAGQTISTNDGDDTVNVTGTTIASTITAGEGGPEVSGDTLHVTGGGIVNMNDGTVTEFEKVTMAMATTFTANTEAGLAITGSTGNDSITLGASTQSVTTAGTGDDTIIVTNAMLLVNMALDGGANTVIGDTLQVSDDASLTDSEFAFVNDIENLVLLGTGSQSIEVGVNAAAAGIVSIDASAATGGVLVDALAFGTTGLDITTGTGNDLIFGGDGNDTITTSDGSDDIYAGGGDDSITTGISADTIYGEDGADTVYAGGEDDSVYGEDGDDVLYGDDGRDHLDGGSHNDTIYGGAGEDNIYGEDGADVLAGGDNNDTYVFLNGDVVSGETVTEGAAEGTADTFLTWFGSVDFSALAAADLDEIEQLVIWDGQTATFTGAQLNGETLAINEFIGFTNTNLVINVNDSGSLTQDFSGLTFASFFTDSFGTRDGFDDGSDTVTIDASAATVGQSVIGTTIADTINGSIFADFIEGHGGTDLLQGGDGDDVYVVADSAHHTAGEITDTGIGGTDRLAFTSATAFQTLTIYATDTGLEAVTIGTVLGNTTGTTDLNVDASAVLLNGLAITGNNGANNLTGTGFADTITGNAGNDTITGGAGSDALSGGDGGDTFIVGTITDYGITETIDGGANAGGVDTLQLNDAGTYAFAGPADLVGIEVVSLNENAAGWNLSFVDADYTFADTGGDGTPDGIITVSATPGLVNGITVVAGTIGAAGHLTVVGTNLGGNDTVTVGGGTDNINTGAGDDTVNILSTTYAGDTLNGGTGGESTGDTLAITGGGTIDISTGVSGFENVTIDNNAAGNVFTANDETLDIQVSGGSQAVTINLGSGAQDVTINLLSGNDTVNLGVGINVVDTGGGADIVTNIGAGDNVSLGADADTAVFSAVALATIGGGEGGTDSDTLQIDVAAGPMTIDLSLTNLQQVTGAASDWQNFENLDADAVGVTDLTVTANAAGSTILTGSGADDVTLGIGADTVNTGGGSDTVSGGVGVGDAINLGAGSDTFIFEDLTGDGTVDGGADNDTLEVQVGTGPLSITLGTGAIGLTNYSNFENLDATASADAMTVTAAAGGSVIDTGSGNDDITAGIGTDLIDAGAGDDIIRITSATYNALDTIDGGADTTDDTLAVTGGGTVDMNTGSIQNIELVQISNSTAGTNTFTANDDSLAITVSGGNENATINLGDTGTQSVTITGSGSDTVALGSGINVVNTGNGADTVTGALGTGDAVDLQAGNDNYSFNDLSNDGTVSGGAGDSDILTIGSAGVTNVTITLGDGANTTINSVDYSNFDNLAAGASDDALVVTAALAGSSIATGSQGDTITLGAGTDTVNAGDGSDTVNSVGNGDVVNLEGSDDFFTYAAVTATVDAGKTGETLGDELTITATTGVMTIDLSVVDGQQITVGGTGTYRNFNDLNAGAVGVDDALTVTAAAGGSTITTGSAADFITLGAGIDTVNSGDEADTVNNIGAGDTVNLEDGDDGASFAGGTAATINGGEFGETLGDTLTITSTSGAMVIDLSISGGQQISGPGAGAGSYQNFENLIATGVDDALEVTADTVGSSITTGDAADIVHLGAGTDTVSTGGSVDTIDGSLTIGDSINFGGGDESYTYEATAATVDGGEGTETNGDQLTVGAGMGAMTINLDLVDLQQITLGGTGTWMNFEDLSAALADSSLNVTASSGGSTITTGSANDQIVLGAGIDIVNAGDGNDGVSGLLTAGDQVTLGAGDDNFTYSSLVLGATLNGDIGSDTLVYNLDNANPVFIFNVDLTNTNHIITDDAGDYQNFENFNSQTSNDIIHLISNAGAGVVTGSGADVIYLAAGGESINTFTGNDTFHGTAATIDNADNINGGGGALDTLNITGGGTINLATATVTNIEVINTDATLATNLILNTMSVTVTMGTAGDTLILGVAGGTATVITGDGDDNVTLGGGQNFITTGNGSDTIFGTLTSGDTIDLGGDNDTFAYSATIDSSNEINGGAGVDTLTYGGGTALTIDFSAIADNIVVDNSTPGADDGLYSNFENLSASGASNILTVTAATTGSVITTGSAADVITLGIGTDIVSTGNGADTVNGTVGGADVVNLQGDNDFFDYQDGLLGDVRGGSESDTLTIDAANNAVTLDLNAAAGFGVYSGFENIAGATADNIITVTASTNGGTINTGLANDVVTLNTGIDTVNTGAGSDTVNGPVQAGDVVDLDADIDTFAYRVLGGDVRGGAGSDIITVALADGAVTLDLTVGTGNGNYSGFENISGAAADDIITATASAAGGSITTGSAADVITLNTATDIVNTGDGGDTVNGVLGGADVVDLQGDNDIFGYQDTLAGDVRGGLGSDTLLIEAADGVVSLNLNAGTGFGSYNGFENISGATADDSITVTASTAGGSIVTGTVGDSVTLNTGTDIVSTGNGADTVTGTLDALDVVDLQGDNDSFDYQVLVGDVRGGAGSDSLVIDGSDGAVTLDLNDTFGAGNYSDFENIAGGTADDIITVIASTNVGSITTGSAADDITLNTNTDTVAAGLGTDTIRATATTLDALDNINGEGGNDTLAITGGGTVTMTALVTNMEFVTLGVGGVTFIANNTVGLTITGSGDADTITLGNVLQNVDAGAGDDSITMGAGSQTINGMAGNDTVHATGAQLVGSQITGGTDSDTLDITSASANMNDAAVLADFEFVTLSFSGTTFTANNTVNLTITGSGGGDDITTGGAVQTVNAGLGADTITLGASGQFINGQGGSDTVNVTGTTIGSTIDAGAGDTDVLEVLSGGAVVMGVAVTNFETVNLASGLTSFTANDTDNLTINGSALADTITTGNALTAQTVNAGAGDDNITLGGDGQIINGGDGDDTVNVSSATIASTITAGEGGPEVAGDTLNVTGGGTVVMGGGVTEFERVTLAIGTNFTANTEVNLLITGSGFADTITVGATSQVVDAGAGNDVIVFTTDLQFDFGMDINGEGDTDTLRISNEASVADGGFSLAVSVETLELAYTGTNSQSVVLGANAEGAGIVTVNASVATGNVTVSDATGTGALSITTGTGNDTINLGTAGSNVVTSTGNDTVNVNGTTIASTINAGVGNTDVLNVAADGALVVVMGAGVTNFETVSLASGLTSFTANDTDNLTINGSATADVITTGNATTAQTVNAGAGDDTITLGGDGQIINAGDGDDTVNVTATTIVSTITAGEGGPEVTGDTLNVTGGGTVLMGAGVTEFEFVTLNEATTFTANDTADLVIEGSAGGNDVIFTGNAFQQVFADFGGAAGDDTITLGAAGQTIFGENGNDLVHSTGAFLVGATIDGGGDTLGDTLDITSTSADMTAGGASITNFEFVTLSAAGTTFVANNDATLTIGGSTGNDTITVGHFDQIVNAGNGDDVIVATYAQVSANTVDFNGDANNDTLRISTAATALVDADFTTVSSIETLQLAHAGGTAQSVTLDTLAMAAGLNTVNASAATGTAAVTVDASAFGNTLAITTGTGNDVVVLGGGINVVSTGAGSDSVTGALTTDDTINLGADNDIFIFQSTVSASNFVDGSTETDQITYSGGAKTFNFSTLLNNVTGETGSYRNFENLDATAATGIITATAATTGSVIDTNNGVGGYNDIINLGAGTDDIATYEGNDTVNATGATLAGDTIDAGENGESLLADVLAITGGGVVVMGVAVTNFETVTLATATTFTANDTLGLTITGSGSGTDIITTGAVAQTVNAGSGNDTIIVGAVGQTIDAGNGNDTVVLSVAEATGAVNITGGNNSDTLEFSGGGIVDIGALGTIFSFENISTGTTAIDLTLTNTGFLVNVQGGGGVDHVIDATVNTGLALAPDDTFKFDASNWAGSVVTIDNFLSGSLNDVLDLSLLGIQTYWGEIPGAGVDVNTVLTGGGIEAVFDTNALYVDLNGDGNFVFGDDLQILLTGVTNLTEATDLLI